MSTGEDRRLEQLQAEVLSLRARAAELEERERALRAEAEEQQRHGEVRAAALEAEREYVREQAVASRQAALTASARVADLEAEVEKLRGRTQDLRTQLEAAREWIARSPYFRTRRWVGRLLGRH